MLFIRPLDIFSMISKKTGHTIRHVPYHEKENLIVEVFFRSEGIPPLSIPELAEFRQDPLRART